MSEVLSASSGKVFDKGYLYGKRGRTDYEIIEKYMQQCMSDSAHDREHVYRVLYVALDIASYEKEVDMDVLIAACLLHDIARKEQLENPALCHARVGAKKAFDFLNAEGYEEHFAKRVASCIRTHRYRKDEEPDTLEAKILFDADKIDATGALGIARTLFYIGQVGEPLYSLDEDGNVLDGASDVEPSFFHEYKLEKLYSKFYTVRGKQIAAQRQEAAVSFYENIYHEVQASYAMGKKIIVGNLN